MSLYARLGDGAMFVHWLRRWSIVVGWRRRVRRVPKCRDECCGTGLGRSRWSLTDQLNLAIDEWLTS